MAHKKLSYAVEQRMRFIDFMLKHYGYIKRQAVMGYFGISEAAATRDMRRYKEMAPDNMMLDQSKKCYHRTTAFQEVFV